MKMLWLLLLGFHTALIRASLPPGTCEAEGRACEAHEDNLVGTEFNIESAAECEVLCINIDTWEFISHFGPASFPGGRAAAELKCELFLLLPSKAWR